MFKLSAFIIFAVLIIESMTASVQTTATPPQAPSFMTMPEGQTIPPLPLFQDSTCLDECLRSIISRSPNFRIQYCADQCNEDVPDILFN